MISILKNIKSFVIKYIKDLLLGLRELSIGILSGLIVDLMIYYSASLCSKLMSNDNTAVNFLNIFSNWIYLLILSLFVLAGAIKFLIIVYFDVRKHIDNQNFEYSQSKTKLLSSGINSLPGNSSEQFKRVAANLDDFSPPEIRPSVQSTGIRRKQEAKK